MTEDLTIARQLCEVGIPVFVHYSKPPTGWQNTRPLPAMIDAWNETRGLCAVMGHGIDLIDIDPRNGGNREEIIGYIPEEIIVGETATPSGGSHLFIQSLALRSHDGFLQGIDYKGGDSGGIGRGFAFIPPTLRESKTTHELTAYRWVKEPDLSRVKLCVAGADSLRALITMHQSKTVSSEPGSTVIEGDRNKHLTSLAGAMRRRGSTESVILAALLAENEERCSPPLTEREVMTIAHSVSRYEPEANEKALFKPVDGESHVISMAQLVGRERRVKDEIIPGYFERRDRCIVTGGEGDGKSTLLRQWAAQAAYGINPFTWEPMKPIKVLVLDCENSEEQVMDEMQALCWKSGRQPIENLQYAIYPAGLEIDKDDKATFERILRETRPDLVAAGPLYKMISSDLKDENASKRLINVLDDLRMKYGFALILESHQIQEYTSFSQKDGEFTQFRAPRPYGHSTWRRWPEYGLNLQKDGQLVRWRGDRVPRDWPARYFRNGSPWLWTIADETGRAKTVEATAPQLKLVE